MKYFLMLFPTALFTSCLIFNTGSVSSGPLHNVSDRFVDISRGEARSANVILAGEMSRSDLVWRAKMNMMQDRPLMQGEYYANYTCDVAHKYFLFGLISENHAIVTAEILRSESAPVARDSGYFIQVAINFTPDKRYVYRQDTFRLGEVVYFRQGKNRFEKFEIARIRYPLVLLRSAGNPANTVESDARSIFYSTSKTLYGIGAGRLATMNGFKVQVVGVSGNRFLLKSDDYFYEKGYASFSVGRKDDR